MATVYSSPRFGRAVVLMEDGSYYLLDVENGETAVECPPSFLRMLYSTAPDVSIQTTDEQPPFPRTYEALLQGWRREQTTSLVLLALDGQMSSALRTTSAQLANDLLAHDDCLAAAQARLASAPLSDEADFNGVPTGGAVLRDFLDFLRARQPSIQRATDTWVRARVRVAEYSSWAAQLRETAVRLGGFLAMSSALEHGSPEEFESWLSKTLSAHPQAASSDLLRILLAWKDEALAPFQSEQSETEHTGSSAIGQPPGGLVVVQASAQELASTADRIEEFLRALRTGALLPEDILSTFVNLAPSWLQTKAEEQSRSLADLVHDLLRSGALNLAGITELAHQQERFPDLREVWVFAQRPLDLEETFYTVVRHNIRERFVKYYYYVSDEDFYPSLRERLIRDLADPTHVDQHVYCRAVPPVSFFVSPGIGIMIPGDITKMKGVHVTSLGDDGTIREAQELPKSELRRAYLQLRSMIEKDYGRKSFPRLPDESPMPTERPRPESIIDPNTIQ